MLCGQSFDEGKLPPDQLDLVAFFMSTTAPDTRITVYNPIVPTTVFEAQFPVFDNDDLSVFLNGEELSAFAVSAIYVEGVSNDAKVTFATGLVGKVEVVGNRDPHRTNRFGFGPIPPRDLNLAFDTLESEMQEARRDISRALLAPYGETPPNTGEIIEAAQTAVDAAAAAEAAVSSINIKNVVDRASLKTLDTAVTTLAFLREPGREGLFKWTSGNLSAQIAADSLEGVYIKADAVSSISGAWVRVLKDTLNLKWFGAVGDGTTSDQAAVQAAFSLASYLGKVLYVPEATVAYRLTAPVVNSNKLGVKLKGEGTEITENNNYNSNGVNARGRGSWFFIDHAGKGFEFTGRDNGTNLVGNSHIGIDGIGTFRNQPLPGAGWVPGDFDYDFDFTQCTADIDDLTLLNATKGINWKRARSGQLNIGKLRGQPLQIGLHVQNAYDVVRVADIHFWPFWSLDDDVMSYIRQNAEAVLLRRCDGPIFNNIFTFGYSRSILFSHFAGNGTDEPGGTTYHGSFDTIYADLGGQAFAIGAEADGCTIDVKRIIAEQTTAISTNTPNAFVAGPNAKVSIGHLMGNNARANVLLNVGANSKIAISRFEPRIFNRSAVGFAALDASAAGAEIEVGQLMNGWTPNGAALAFESAGGRVSGIARRGVATIPSGAPGVTVTHGLGVTPRGIHFDMDGAGAQAAGANLPRVSAKTGTTFTVDIGVTATANRDIAWTAFY